jgi:hypothetical protein
MKANSEMGLSMAKVKKHFITEMCIKEVISMVYLKDKAIMFGNKIKVVIVVSLNKV